jgi:hypothetical protein
LKKSSFIASFGRTYEMLVFDFSHSHAIGQVLQSAFCPKVFTTYFLCPFLVQSKRTHTYTHLKNTHAHARARAQGESQVSVILIVPSRHMLWRSVEDALFWELDVVVFSPSIMLLAHLFVLDKSKAWNRCLQTPLLQKFV